MLNATFVSKIWCDLDEDSTIGFAGGRIVARDGMLVGKQPL